MNNIISDLKKKGFRITKVRNAIILILASTKNPIGVTDIIARLYRKDLSANKTTVYRELTFLINQNIATEVDFGDGKKRYELNSSHHHHIVCLTCGTISDIDFDLDLATHQKDIEKQTSFKVKEHNIEFFGLCKTCQY